MIRTDTLHLPCTDRKAEVVVDIPDTDNLTNDPRDPVTGTTTRQWRILSFNAKDFVEQEGPGIYTAILDLQPAAGKTKLGYSVPDMGFSIYGVIEGLSTAAVRRHRGREDDFKGSGSTLPDSYAEALFKEPITPRGDGEKHVVQLPER